MDRMRTIKGMTRTQYATFSNNICGDVESARELEAMGLVKIRKTEVRNGREIAFFDLTEKGEKLHTEHFTTQE